MATEGQGTLRQTMADSTVYDMDVHVQYTKELQKAVSREMDQPWRNYTDPDVYEGGIDFRYPSEGIPKSLGGKRRFEIANTGTPEAIEEGLCREFGIDHPVLNVLAPLDRIFTTERAIAEMRGINNVLLDRFLDHNDDFRGAISLSIRRPEAAAEEIDRLGSENQVDAAFIVSGQEFQKPVGDPTHDIIFEALADNELTPLFHVTEFTRKAPCIRDYETAFEYHATGPPWSTQYGLVSLIAQGVPAKFPELDFVILEGGIGWVPFYMARLNREYGQWRSELPLLEKSPEEYLRDQFYFATQPMGEFNDPSHMLDIIRIVGADSLCFASDFPHFDFDNPNSIDAYFGQLSAEEREQILTTNAREILGR